MPDRLSDIEARLERVEEAVRVLGAGVSPLRSIPEASDASSPAIALLPGTLDSATLLTLTGRTFIVLGGAYALFGTRSRWLRDFVAMVVVPIREASAAAAGVVRGFGSSLPLVIGAASAALLISILLVCALVVFVRAIRPRLEAS